MFDDDYEANLGVPGDSPMSAGFEKVIFFKKNDAFFEDTDCHNRKFTGREKQIPANKTICLEFQFTIVKKAYL